MEAMSRMDPAQPFLMGVADILRRNFLWSGPGFVLSSELLKRLDPTTVMTRSSLWEFSCSFRGCCDFANCYADAHQTILQDFDACNDLLVLKCGTANTTDYYESCIRE